MAETTKNDEPPDASHHDAFQQWLETKPREWSVVIAARAALRVLPLGTANFGSEEADAILLPVLRANAIARFAALYPNLAIEATAAAVRPASAAAHAAASPSAASASEAAARAAAVRDPSDAARAAARAASASAAYGAYATAAIRQDARVLTTNITAEQLARAPLRRSEEPGDLSGVVGQAWIELKINLLRLGPHWQAWTNWYDEVLAGSPPLPARSEEWDAAFTDVEHSS